MSVPLYIVMLNIVAFVIIAIPIKPLQLPMQIVYILVEMAILAFLIYHAYDAGETRQYYLPGLITVLLLNKIYTVFKDNQDD